MDRLSIDEDMVREKQSPSDLANITRLLLDSQFPRRKTILGKFRMTPITTLDTIAQLYDISFLKLWIPSYCEYVTSEDGKGREQIVDITKFSIEREDQQRKRMEDILGNRR